MEYELPENPWTRRDRRRFTKAFGLLPYCDVAAGGAWADLGCGDGIFSAVLADLLGEDGCVFAVDRASRELRHLQRNLHPTDWTTRIQPLQADFRFPLPFHDLDGVVVANALHFLRDGRKTAAFRIFASALRPGGSLIVIEYNTDRSTSAVPHPLPADRLRRLLRDAGWRSPNVLARVPSTYLGEMVAIQSARLDSAYR